MKTLICGGRIIDPAQNMDEIGDILIEDGKIAQIAPKIIEEADQTINAEGHVVMPGFIDLHVHLREPGFEYKETIRTGAMAAARGGVTTICPMPNTKPAIDSPERVKDLLERAKDAAVHILPIGAVTIGQEGNELADIAGMKEAGAVALSEDGKSVMDSLVFRHALKEAAKNKIPMFSHCEDKALVDGGVMNAGAKAEELGLPGITNAVEDVIVARDILMAKETGCRLHLCHCSTADSVLLIEMAKQQGLPVTGEVCPHQFTKYLTHFRIRSTNHAANIAIGISHALLTPFYHFLSYQFIQRLAIDELILKFTTGRVGRLYQYKDSFIFLFADIEKWINTIASQIRINRNKILIKGCIGLRPYLHFTNMSYRICSRCRPDISALNITNNNKTFLLTIVNCFLECCQTWNTKLLVHSDLWLYCRDQIMCCIYDSLVKLPNCLCSAL
jgi:hypothetical protein